MGWFTPSPPLDSIEKAWTERRMCWLADQFGIDRLLDVEVILPTDEHFPEAYSPTEENARAMLLSICEHMGLNPDRIKLQVVPDSHMPTEATAKEHTLITVPQSKLHDPERLAAAIVQTVSHEVLIGSGLLSPDEPDTQWVINLLPVYFGAAIFAANSVLREQAELRSVEQWGEHSRQGNLPARIYGYAFAIFAFARGELQPEWASHLRLDASTVIKNGIRYIKKTGDCLLHPDTMHHRKKEAPTTDLIIQLRTGSPSARVAALWEIGERGEPSSELVEAILPCLNDRDPHLPAQAAYTLAKTNAQQAIPHLWDLLDHSSNGIKGAVGYSIARLKAPPEEAFPRLSLLLQSESPRIIPEVAKGIRHYGTQAEPLGKALMPHLKVALIECDYRMIDLLIETLKAIAEDPDSLLQEHFSHDEELLTMATDALNGTEHETSLSEDAP